MLRRLLVTLVVPMQTALGQQSVVRFASAPCHISFAHPATWDVVRDTTDPQRSCDFLIRPRDWPQRLIASDSVDVYTVSVRSVPGEPATAAQENGFEHRGRRWVILGETVQPADTVSGPGWHGWRGLAGARCYKIDGPYAGQCDEPTAIVGTASRSVVVRAEPQGEEVFDRLLRTLRLE